MWSTSQARVTKGSEFDVLFGLAKGTQVTESGHHPRKSGKDTIMVNIYVGNLSYNMTEDELRSMFEAHGKVDSANLAMDRQTGRARGFGFVEMPNDAEARAAIDALNETEIQGRKMQVNEAKPKTERAPRRGRY
jgi:RNA recognition motif-containing protein